MSLDNISGSAEEHNAAATDPEVRWRAHLAASTATNSRSAPQPEESEKASAFLKMWNAGYKYLVPIVPPGSPISDQSILSKKPKAIGKVPGIRGHDGFWTSLKQWQSLQPTEDDLRLWFAMGAGVGLRFGLQADGTYLYGIDADTKVKGCADIVRAQVEGLIGNTPTRIGQAPKALYIVRTSGPLPYMSIGFDGGVVEVLGQGKQAVAANAIHPVTLAPYVWTRGLVPLEDLTVFDPEVVTALLESLKARLPKAGDVYREGSGNRSTAQQDLTGVVPELERAVPLIPNVYKCPGRDSFVRMAAAFRGAFQDDYERGLELFCEWADKADLSSRPDDSVHEDPTQVYRSVKAPFSLGAGYLYELAEAADASGDFKRDDAYAAKHFDETAAAKQPISPATAPSAVLTPFNGEPVDLFGNADPAALAEPPPGSMPVILEQWAHDVARRMGVPVALPAAAGLAVVGAAIGCSLKIRSRLCDDREEPAALWMIIVAEPGSTKSPVIAAAVRPLRMLDRERYDSDKAKHDNWTARAKRLPKNVVPTEPEPKIRRSVVDDVTIEKQIRIHMENPRGILRAPDEFMGLLGSLGAYKKGAQVDRTQILRTFDGGEITVDRVGSGSTRASSALMGIIAGTQPDIIKTLTRDLGSDGLLQRCIFVTHDGQRRQELDEHPDTVAVDAYGSAIRTLAMGETGSTSTVSLSRSAYEVLMRANDEIAAMRDLPGASKEWAGHISKWGKILPRLVLCFHALDHVEAFGGLLPGATIDISTVEKAVRFARFLLRHSLQFHETYFGERAEASEARNIAGYLLTKPELSRVNRRNIYDARTNLRGAENARALQAAMRELEYANWVEPVEADQHGAKAWAINPAVHQRFDQQAKRERDERRRGRERIMRAGDAREWLSSGDSSGPKL